MLFIQFLLVFILGFSEAKVIVNDVTQINPIQMDKVIRPTSTSEIQKAIKETMGLISIGGGRFSMGGQTAIDQGVQIDMTMMNKILNLDLKHKKVTVQAGIRWRDLQEHIDKHDLSIKIMQTYANFTVGGSLSVNAHGRYVGEGPIIRSVDSLKMILADGREVDANQNTNSDIFHAAIGGYGAIGVITEVTLQLVDNTKVESRADVLALQDYKNYFFKTVRNNKDFVFHNADLYPPEFTKVRALSWIKSTRPLTETRRLQGPNQKHFLKPLVVGSIAVMPKGKRIREKVIDPYLGKKPQVVWRNFEASYDVAELEPLHRKLSTYVLQEYFIPVDRLEAFVPKMKKVFDKHDVNVVNVSIRHAFPDSGSVMAWAREEVFSLVIYIRQGITEKEKEKAGVWTREMIDEVLSEKGTYYLPYQLHATDEQFKKAYPKSGEFFAVKKKYDPGYRFKNKFLEKYFKNQE